MEDQNKRSAFDKFSFGAIFLLGFLLPIFFLPINGIPLDASKAILVALFTLVSFSLWLLGRLVDGAFSLPKSVIFLGSGILGLSVLLASLLSPAPYVSLIGQGFETGTFAFFAISLVLLFLSANFFESRERVFYFYGALLASALLVALFQIIRLVVGADTLSLGIFQSQVSNLVGKWNDLSIFFGLTALLSLITVEFLSLTRGRSLLMYAVIVLSLFFLALINFSLVWLVVGIVALSLVIYGIYANRLPAGAGESVAPTVTMREVKLPMASLAVALVSFVFFISSTTLGSYLPTKFNISQLEVRPSLSATLEIAKKTLKENPLFGSGPNRFTSEWLLHKPDGINSSIFWNTDFNSGFGIVPTSLVTNGIVGFLAWILFLGLFLYSGFRAMFNFSLNRLARYLIVSSFVLSAYLWTFVVFYVPNTTLYILAFILTGVLVATLQSENLSGRFTLRLLSEPKSGFISVLLIIFLLIGSVSLGYLFVERFSSYAYFQKSLSALNDEGSLDKTEIYLGKAIKLSDQDVYYRANSELGLIKLNNLLQQTSIPQDTLRTEFQTLLGAAIDSARRATELDKTNYGNFVSLGRVYEAIVPLNITGAYESAKDSYNKALALNPESPAIFLTLARLEVARNNIKEGRAYIDKALAKKQNYTEAVFFLSQLEAREGNIREAIRRTEEASLLAPNDLIVFFQLGLLKYSDRNYAGSISALERAISLSPNYSNAKYFLGLSYQEVGRVKDAIKQFEEVRALNPDNQEVKNILANLKAGRAPFANIPPPDNKPEARPKPPIEE